MEKIRFGVIGLGKRGFGVMQEVLLNSSYTMVTAVCDPYEDRAAAAAEKVYECTEHRPFTTADYRALLDRADVDAVYIASSWETHNCIAIDAMRARKAVASEVGGVCDLAECYDLVRVQEETGTPYMLMENCCFGEDELLATAMARAGKFGEIVHCHGAYAHDLRSEVTGGLQDRHYRLRHYRLRNADNYPTHDLGPIAKLLNINRGNRMLTLTSTASKAAGLRDYLAAHADTVDPRVKDMTFAQGDIVTTMIKCAGGETISLSLDTTLPRSYSREFTVRGTRGLFEAPTGTVFLDGMKEYFDTVKFYRENLGNAASYKEEFLPYIWRHISEEEMFHGHGGMDALEFAAFAGALLDGKPMPVDVYDAAAWMSVTVLSERSIALDGAPQSFPDFTRGMWASRAPQDVTDLQKR